MLVPNFAIVVDNSSTEAPCWVNPGTSDGNGGQVNHENGKPNGQWGQHLHKLTPFYLQTTTTTINMSKEKKHTGI